MYNLGDLASVASPVICEHHLFNSNVLQVPCRRYHLGCLGYCPLVPCASSRFADPHSVSACHLRG